jgi:hypothetical protein
MQEEELVPIKKGKVVNFLLKSHVGRVLLG